MPDLMTTSGLNELDRIVFSVCKASFIFRQAVRARRIGKVHMCEKLHMIGGNRREGRSLPFGN